MKREKYFYKSFGIKISSELPIPELKTTKPGNTDAVIKYGSVSKPDLPNRKHSSKVESGNSKFTCYINDIGGVRVDRNEITVCPEDGSEERGFRFLVSGVAFGLLLHLRGFVTLHASAVAIQNCVVAFVGHSGMGKSTTAAALHSRGHSVVTDDLLVLSTDDNTVTAYPGFPHLKLTPESIVKSVNEDPELIPKIDPEGPKHSFAAEKDFLEESLPLRRIYVLDYQTDERAGQESSAPFSEAISGKEACIELVRNSYVARLLPEEAISQHHLKRSAEIAQSVPVRRLYREKSLSNLSTLAAFIEQERVPNGRLTETSTNHQTRNQSDEDAR